MKELQDTKKRCIDIDEDDGQGSTNTTLEHLSKKMKMDQSKKKNKKNNRKKLKK